MPAAPEPLTVTSPMCEMSKDAGGIADGEMPPSVMLVYCTGIFPAAPNSTSLRASFWCAQRVACASAYQVSQPFHDFLRQQFISRCAGAVFGRNG